MKNLVYPFLLVLGITSCKEEQAKFLVLDQIIQQQDSLVIFDLSDLESLTTDSITASLKPMISQMHIKFTLDPTTDDESKKIFVAGLRETLKKLEAVKPATTIKTISFDIGEQIFVTQNEADSVGGDYYKTAEINLQKAWTELTPQLKRLFPEAKFYAHNWGW